MIPRRSAEPTPLTPVELRPFGQTGLHVSALGFGGANIGFTDISDKTLDRLFGAAFELGVNLIDTAAMYGDSEEKDWPCSSRQAATIPNLHKMRTVSSAQAQFEWILYAPAATPLRFPTE